MYFVIKYWTLNLLDMDGTKIVLFCDDMDDSSHGKRRMFDECFSLELVGQVILGFPLI